MNRLMTLLNISSRAALVAAALIALNSCPAQAQEFSLSQPEAPQAQPQVSEAQQALNQLPAEVRAKMQPGVRYTVGAKVTQGWEQSLTRGNQNLGHFYWSPMVNYMQATPSRKTGSQAVSVAPPAKPREFHYAKPRTAPLACNPAAIRSNWKQAPARTVTISRAKSDVSAKIAFRSNNNDVSASLVARPTEAKAYRSYNSDQSASGSLSSKDAYGQIIRR
jgi:hypothetical protein